MWMALILALTLCAQDGCTALMWACMENQLEVVQALLAAGVDKEAVGEEVDGGSAHTVGMVMLLIKRPQIMRWGLGSRRIQWGW